MIREQGSLLIGVEYDGRLHADFTIRPQLVRDSIEALSDERAANDQRYLGVSILAKQIEKLGDIPKEQITADLLMNMYNDDFTLLVEADRRLEARLRSFRESGASVQEDGAGNAEDGVSSR